MLPPPHTYPYRFEPLLTGFADTAKVLRDDSRVGAGTSKYFRIKKEKAAA